MFFEKLRSLPDIQGSPLKFTGFLEQISLFCSEATETCNTAKEREFSQLLELVLMKKLRLLKKFTDWFK